MNSIIINYNKHKNGNQQLIYTLNQNKLLLNNYIENL